MKVRQEIEIRDLLIPVKILCYSTDGGGSWFEYQYYDADGNVIESTQEYGNPIAALRDGLTAWWS